MIAPPPRRTRQAFTLLEILMVMVIIALLVALLFVVISPARRQSKEVVCLSNLRQMYISTQMYRDDYNGTDPAEGEITDCRKLGTPCTGDMYHHFLETYIKDKEVAICPAYPGTPPPNRLCSYLPNMMIGEDELPAEYKQSALSQHQNIMSKMGARAPMYACHEYHNPPLNYAAAARDATKRVMLVRYNGSAEQVVCPVRMFMPFEKIDND